MKRKLNLPDRFIHQTTRYVLGRMSYAVGEHCRWLIDNWKKIPYLEQEIIKKDIELEFEMHERMMTHDPSLTMTNLGHSYDVIEWSKVRELWRNK